MGLVAVLRRANPTVPILMVSGVDQEKAALSAGATRFLSYEKWLVVGNVMSGLLAETRSPFESAGPSDGSAACQPA